MTNVDIHHLAATYSLDALDEAEREAFDAHFRTCEICRDDILAFRETMGHVAASVAVAPSDAVRTQVADRVKVTRQLSPTLAPVARLVRPRNLRAGLLAVAASLVLVVVTATLIDRPGSADTYTRELARVMAQTDVVVTELAPTEAAGDAAGSFRVAYSPRLGEAVLIGADLPTTPSGSAYELWLITATSSNALYVLDTAADGLVQRVVPADEQPVAWAITVEPAAGSPVATGAILYIAEL